jgi:uncharacterized membrane protein
MRPADHRLRNEFFIALLVVTNTLGNLFVAIGMDAMPQFQAGKLVSYSIRVLTDAWFVSGIALMMVWMVAQLSMFTWADLSYVLPMTASSYAFTAILGKFFLNEKISIERWTGIGLISFGVILVAETPVWTHNAPPQEEEP